MAEASDFDYYKHIRDEIQREHGKINSRMGWFMAHQTVLVGATVAIFATDQLCPAQKCVLALILILAGLALSCLWPFSLNAARKKVEVLRATEKRYLPKDKIPGWPDVIDKKEEWQSVVEDDKSPVPIWYTGSPEDVDRSGLVYPRVTPWVVIILWLAILAWGLWVAVTSACT